MHEDAIRRDEIDKCLAEISAVENIYSDEELHEAYEWARRNIIHRLSMRFDICLDSGETVREATLRSIRDILGEG